MAMLLIKTDLIKRTLLTSGLKSAGKALNGEKPSKPSTGDLQGMAGIEVLLYGYNRLVDLYNKLGQVAMADAENMLTIAKEFDRLDHSTGG